MPCPKFLFKCKQARYVKQQKLKQEKKRKGKKEKNIGKERGGGKYKQQPTIERRSEKKKKAEGCGGLPSSWRDGLPTKSGSSCAGLMGLACQKWSFVPRWPSVLFSVFQPARKS